MNYRDTLNLPRDILPMRANLPQREPEFQKEWEQKDVYRKSVERPAGRGAWILHDGPPYSNGDIHMGHALNKLLKDFITRHRTMQGYSSPYVPGWDNHGLPIEHAVVQQARDAGETPDRVELRRRCRAYAQKYVDLQRERRDPPYRPDTLHVEAVAPPELELQPPEPGARRLGLPRHLRRREHVEPGYRKAALVRICCPLRVQRGQRDRSGDRGHPGMR